MSKIQMTTVLYFGNELVPEDRAAIEAVERIKKFFPKTEFIHCLSPEEILLFRSRIPPATISPPPNQVKGDNTSPQMKYPYITARTTDV